MKYIVSFLLLVSFSSCDKHLSSTVSGTYSGTLEYNIPGDYSTYVDSSFILTITDLGENKVHVLSTAFDLGEFSCQKVHMGQHIRLQSLTEPSLKETMGARAPYELNWKDSLPDNSMYFDFQVDKD